MNVSLMLAPGSRHRLQPLLSWWEPPSAFTLFRAGEGRGTVKRRIVYTVHKSFKLAHKIHSSLAPNEGQGMGGGEYFQNYLNLFWELRESIR